MPPAGKTHANKAVIYTVLVLAVLVFAVAVGTAGYIARKSGPQQSSAASIVTLKGTVVDAVSQPVSGAVVIVSGFSATTDATGVFGSSGTFRIPVTTTSGFLNINVSHTTAGSTNRSISYTAVHSVYNTPLTVSPAITLPKTATLTPPPPMLTPPPPPPPTLTPSTSTTTNITTSPAKRSSPRVNFTTPVQGNTTYIFCSIGPNKECGLIVNAKGDIVGVADDYTLVLPTNTNCSSFGLTGTACDEFRRNVSEIMNDFPSIAAVPKPATDGRTDSQITFTLSKSTDLPPRLHIYKDHIGFAEPNIVYDKTGKVKKRTCSITLLLDNIADQGVDEREMDIVIVHEVSHCFGLGHSFLEGDGMFPSLAFVNYPFTFNNVTKDVLNKMRTSQAITIDPKNCVGNCDYTSLAEPKTEGNVTYFTCPSPEPLPPPPPPPPPPSGGGAGSGGGGGCTPSVDYYMSGDWMYYSSTDCNGNTTRAECINLGGGYWSCNGELKHRDDLDFAL